MTERLARELNAQATPIRNTTTPTSEINMSRAKCRPELSALQRALSELSWSEVKCMAIHLPEMKFVLLTDIERDHPVEERVLYAMKTWLDRDSQASWTKLVSALRAISKNTLALEIETKHCGTVEAVPTPCTQKVTLSQLVHERPPVLAPQPPSVQVPAAHSPQPEDQTNSGSIGSSQVTATTFSSTAHTIDGITVSQCSALREFLQTVDDRLVGIFVSLIVGLKLSLLIKSPDFLSKFKVTLTTLPLSKRHQHLLFLKREKKRIMKAKDIDEIFDLLEPYWDYTDYSLLEYLIKEFGSRQLQQEMERYIAQLEQFEKMTHIQGFNLARRNIPSVQLQEQFVTTLIHTKICIMERESESMQSQSFLLNFKVTLTTLPLSKRHQHLHFLKKEKDRIKKAKDIDEIFDILEPYWNYTDYSLLEYLINKFGTRELQQEMERYIAQLEQFEKTDLAVQGKRDNEGKKLNIMDLGIWRLSPQVP